MSAAQRTAGPAPRNCGPGTSGPCTRPSFSTGRTAVALALDLLEFSAAEADPPADVFADLGEDSFQCANRLATGAVSADMEIGRAHVCTPVTNAHLVCRLLLEKQQKT